MRQGKRNILWFALYALIAVASLWLRGVAPVMAIANATHDDFLFVRLAYFLGAGQWLGPYDNLTLAKGMAYPAFILAAFLAGLPLKIAEQLVYLAVAGLAAALVTRMAGRCLIGLILFAVLAFNPSLWHPELARVIREGLYGSLSPALILLAVGALLGHRWGWRLFPHRLALFVAAGLVAGVYWLTREEGVWLAPPLGILVLAVLLDAAASWRRGERRSAGRLLAGTIAGGAAAALVAAAIVGAVALANQRSYSLLVTNEYHSSGFPAAYGALSRVRHDAWRRYVVFPKDAREKAYAVSAAARELKASLDGEQGEAWRRVGCFARPIDPCTEIQAGWLMWAVRDAAAAAGHYTSAREADAFYRRLAGEINAACEDGRLSCLSAPPSVAPLFRWHYLGDALGVVPALGRILLRVGNGEVGAHPSTGLEAGIEIMADLVGPISRPLAPSAIVVGTIETKGAVPELLVRNRGFEAIRFEVVVKPSGATRAVGDHKTFEFELTTDCRRPACDFVARSGSTEIAHPLTVLSYGNTWQVADAKLWIGAVLERGDGTSRPIASQKLQRMKLAVAGVIARAYVAAMPALALLAGLGFVVALWRRHALPAGILALSLACAAAVAARMALLAYMEVTLIPAINHLYLSPATPFFLTFVVLGIYCGVAALRDLARSKRLVQQPHPTR